MRPSRRAARFTAGPMRSRAGSCRRCCRTTPRRRARRCRTRGPCAARRTRAAPGGRPGSRRYSGPDIAGERKDREHAVADELEDLAAVRVYRRDLAVERLVERVDHLACAHALRSSVKPRRSENQITASITSMSPRRILPASTRSPALRPYVGRQQVRRGPPEREDLRHARERPHDPPERADIVVGEAVRALGRESDRVHRAGGEHQRLCEVIREPFLRQTAEDREVAGAVTDPPPDLPLLPDHERDRAGLERVRVDLRPRSSPTFARSPGRHANVRPATSGCSVMTTADSRSTTTPSARRRSPHCSTISAEVELPARRRPASRTVPTFTQDIPR